MRVFIRLGVLGEMSLALDTLLLHLRTILIDNIVFWSIVINTSSDPNSAICLDVRTQESNNFSETALINNKKHRITLKHGRLYIKCQDNTSRIVEIICNPKIIYSNTQLNSKQNPVLFLMCFQRNTYLQRLEVDYDQGKILHDRHNLT